MNIDIIHQILGTVKDLYLSRFGIRKLPRSIFWLVTWKCNSRCLHCEWGKTGDELNKSQDKSRVVSLKRTKEVITEAGSWGARHIAFAGGEPFLRDDFLKILKHCKKEGYSVTVSTNGFLLSDPLFAEQVVETGVDRLDISLDAADALHDKLRDVKNAFAMVDKAIDNLNLLKKKRRFYLGINAIVSAQNMRKLDNLFEYGRKKGVDGIGLQPFHPIQARAKGLIPQFMINKEQVIELKKILKAVMAKYGQLLSNSPFFVKKIAEYYQDNKMPKEACYAGVQEIHIYPDGTVSACCFLRGTQSVADMDLKTILSSESFKGILNKAKNKECPGCWSPPVHEYNLLFKPLEFASGLKLIKTFLKWTKE